MSDQVASGGQGWNIRVRLDDAGGPPAGPPQPPRAHPMSAAGPATTGHMDGTWVAGLGWVAADHPYATGHFKLPKTRKRRRGPLSVAPTSIVGRIAMGLAGSATAGVVLFSVFGWHSWITDFFHGGHDVATPATIAGDPLVIAGPLANLTKQVDDFLASQPIVQKSAGGFYAPPGAAVPSYGVFAVKHSGASMSSGTMSDVVDHISSGQYKGTQHTETRDGVTYTCGNVALGATLGVACVWDDYNVAGFLVSFGDADVSSVMGLTQMARNAIEGTTASSSSTAAKP